jgi:DNA-binding beta-propeller fold protein YncE
MALMGALLLSGCATAMKDLPSWPQPPDQPRIKFVRWIQREGDLPLGTMRKIYRFLAPPPPSNAIRHPLALALSPDEKRLYVANGPEGSVVIVDLVTGAFRLGAMDGTHAPALPAGVALDADENLYVSDSANHVVTTFDRNGRWVRDFGKGKLDTPRSIAIDRKAQIIYVLNGFSRKSESHRIDAFSLKGEHLRTIGKRGGAVGEFNLPSSLTVAPDGRVFVADMLNFRIQIFDSEGNPQGTFGNQGAGEPGTFDKVRAIGFDSFGNMYATDGQQGSVQIFSDKFRVLMAFGGRYEGPGYLRVPASIVISSDNHIYVGDTALRKVSEYVLVNTTAEDSRDPGPTPPASGSAPSAAPAAPASAPPP